MSSGRRAVEGIAGQVTGVVSMGMYCDVYAATSEELEELLAAPETIRDFLGAETTPSTGLQKAWHGLHFLLTGSSWNSEGVLGFLASGGEALGKVDLGYGPARFFRPDAVEQLDDALSRISDDELWSRFDPATMEAEGVYPVIWDEPEEDLQQEYLTYFRNLRAFVHQACRDGNALIVKIA
jgi:Domain of unknown function (DUF1877)